MQLINPAQFESAKLTQALYLENIDLNDTDTSTNSNWLYLTRSQCMQRLQNQHLGYINFAHWLAIPSLNLMLVFKNGICQQIEQGLISTKM